MKIDSRSGCWVLTRDGPAASGKECTCDAKSAFDIIPVRSVSLMLKHIILLATCTGGKCAARNTQLLAVLLQVDVH